MMNDDTTLTGSVLDALSYAVKAHGCQRRKGGAGEPYIAHLIETARLLQQVGGITDTTVIVAAILHDTVEDTRITLSNLRDHFGERVTGIVGEVTDDTNLSKHERRIQQVEHASALSHEARLIKLADKLSNIGSILDSPPIGWSVSERLAYVNWGKDVIDRIRGTNDALEAAFDELYTRAIGELEV